MLHTNLKYDDPAGVYALDKDGNKWFLHYQQCRGGSLPDGEIVRITGFRFLQTSEVAGENLLYYYRDVDDAYHHDVMYGSHTK